MGCFKIPSRVITGSEEQTRQVGRKLSEVLDDGSVVSLEGELGSGKTQVVKGIAEGMGISPDRAVFSPTFTIVNIYEGRRKIYHIDLYRLEGNYDEIEEAGIFEILEGGGIVVIEWGERLKNYLPRDCIRIILKILDEGSRELLIQRGWG